MNNDELIEYAIRTSKVIKEEIKPKLIDYFYKQREVIDKAIGYIQENTCWELRTSKVLDILNEVSE